MLFSLKELLIGGHAACMHSWRGQHGCLVLQPLLSRWATNICMSLMHASHM